ncbi:MAG: hypothetical protein HS126_20330 [Anaerolineales bacterium]|nr:hypothetical protein [Anaerolineales bacterium]
MPPPNASAANWTRQRNNTRANMWLAMARQSRGELAAAQGRLDAALDDYVEAQAGYAAAGNEYEAARCLAAAAAPA